MSCATIEKTDRGFSINGEMSFATVHRLLEVSQLLNFNSEPILEIDLGRVSRADSAGLTLVVEWMARAKRGNTDIRFRNIPKQMREIASMTEVDKILSLCE
ncbi:MAG: STAS domain-containing protein [Methylococcales bacterium]